MVSDTARLLFKTLKFLFPFAFKSLRRSILSVQHRWSYRSSSSAKIVVVLGGSFAGVEVVRRLCESLPTGYRVVLVEKNQCFNYCFNFPRFSAISGYEDLAFIPYDGIVQNAPDGIFELVQDRAVQITGDYIELASGGTIKYEYLVVATGASQPLPARVVSTDKTAACRELQAVQSNIQAAKDIAIIGGGAVGIQLASDIKSFYPEKQVTLVHSRERLLPAFGLRLHTHVMEALEQLGVQVVLGERPRASNGTATDGMTQLEFSGGSLEDFDLVVSFRLSDNYSMC